MPKTSASRKSILINISLTPALVQRINERVADSQGSRAAWIREAIVAKLDASDNVVTRERVRKGQSPAR
jgi:metal-responsive CopG/Arc/MetJ family transcriptional regulator